MNKKLIALVGLVLAVVVTTFSVSGTYAKYTSSIGTETEEARVAVWKVGELTDTDFFKTSYGTNKEIDGKTTKIVAPGAKGTYKFTLAGNFETEVNYVLKAKAVVTDNSIPLVFKVKGQDQEYTTLQEALNKIFSDEIVYAPGYAITNETFEIEWEWKFENERDEDDTNLALNKDASALPKYNVQISLTMEQTQAKATKTAA